eukprot:TRINITY_DN37703_c0_g1_i1.p1 TRINITY_DN37703_c0_g1~~TRINITY_DN37703_c0_g1_i1.p1  ORF type:complete len:151 (-),score=27.28 TRINITY_DN37703_c0_g1_i1:12-464(-)
MCCWTGILSVLGRTSGLQPLQRFSANEPQPSGTGPYANTAFGQRFSNAISYGGLVFITGMVGKGQGIREQTKAALNNVDAVLSQAGTSKDNLLEVTVWLRDIEKDYSGFDEIYQEWARYAPPATRACVEAKLKVQEWLLEVRVIAAKLPS